MGAIAGGGMTEPRWPLALGGRLMIDGETIFVHSVEADEVRGYTAAGDPVRFVLTRLVEQPARACHMSGDSARCCLTPARCATPPTCWPI